MRGAGEITDTYFRDNQALNGASVWQNDCQHVVHSGSRFDDNAATQARPIDARASAARPLKSRGTCCLCAVCWLHVSLAASAAQFKCLAGLTLNGHAMHAWLPWEAAWGLVVGVSCASAQGSAGIELNQCGADIGFCTFARGHGAKGAAIYMQVRPGCCVLIRSTLKPKWHRYNMLML